MVGDEEVVELGMAQRSQGRMAQRSQCRMDLGLRVAEVWLTQPVLESAQPRPHASLGPSYIGSAAPSKWQLASFGFFAARCPRRRRGEERANEASCHLDGAAEPM